MKTKYIFFIISSLLTISVFATYNPYLDFFKSTFPETPKDQALKSFIGDTISFELPKEQLLSNVYLFEPDTIWLKDKKPKKPKEGKHYNLRYNYKGKEQNGKFFTLSDQLIYNPWILNSVDEFYTTNSSGQSERGYKLSLTDVADGTNIYIILDNNIDVPWKIRSMRINRGINDLRDIKVYKKKGDTEVKFVSFSLENGDEFISIKKGLPHISVEPCGNFILKGDDGSQLTIDPNSASLIPSLLSEKEFQEELQKANEAKRIYSIDYAIPGDSVINKVKALPFMNIWGRTKRHNAIISQSIKPGSSPLGTYNTLEEDTYILIGGQLTVRDEDYYMAALDGKPFYIKVEDVVIEKPNDLKYLLDQPEDIKESFFQASKLISRYVMMEEITENYKEFSKYTDRGLVVLNAEVFETNPYLEGTGVTFEFLNSTNKTIKYLTVNYVGYNAVEDPVSIYGRSTLTMKCIGPVDSWHTCQYEEEYAWPTDIVQYTEIKSITVQYTNGTSKKFTGKAVECVPEELIENLEYKSQVNSFLPNYEDNN